MSGMSRKGRQLSVAHSAGSDRTYSQHLLSPRGASTLLVLFALTVGSVALGSQLLQAQQQPRSTTGSSIQLHEPTSENKQELNGAMKHSEPIESSITPTVSATVRVNGRAIDLQANDGIVHEETVTKDGKMTVDVKVDSSTSGSSVQGQSTFKLNVQSNHISESHTE